MTREQWLPVVGLAMTGGIMIGSCTWLLSNQIAGVRMDSITALSVLSSKVAGDEARLDAVEKLEAGHYTEEALFRSDMRSQVITLIDRLAELRVSVGHHEK